MTQPFKILEDRSGLLDYQACPRLRWWSREWARGEVIDGKVHCGGVAPAKSSVYLVLGQAVHTGLNAMLNYFKGRPDIKAPLYSIKMPRELLFEAADVALGDFDQHFPVGAIHVPDAQTMEQVEWKVREARGLVEGLVMVAGLRLIPNLVERFRVVEVEAEKAFGLGAVRKVLKKENTDHYREVGLSPGEIYYAEDTPVVFQSRADALLEERETGDLYVHSWKTSADYGRQEEMQFRRDVQGMSEAVGIEQSGCDGRVMGIQMAFLLKGRKAGGGQGAGADIEWDDTSNWHGLGPGLRWHQSPLTHAWRMESHGILPEDDLSQWAWTKWYPKPENKSGLGKLGKGWESVAVFDEYPGGVRQWVLDLEARRWQPECYGHLSIKDPLDRCLAMPEPWSRSDRELEDWLEQARAQSVEIQERAEGVRDAFRGENWQEARRLLNKYFPQSRRSCYSYGGMCQMSDLCFGIDEIWQRPLENGFGLRVPHHQVAEAE